MATIGRGIRIFLGALALGWTMLVASADPADDAYLQVRGCYHQLLQNARPAADSYAACSGRFTALAAQYPDHPRAAEAHYSAGLVHRLEYQRTRRTAAAKRAWRAFVRVAKRYDTHSLADDALLQSAQILAGPLGRERAALRSANQLLKQHPNGDRQAAARRLQQTLQQGRRFVLPDLVAERTSAPARTPAHAVTSGEIRPAEQAPAAGGDLAGLRITIDAGHGGSDPGARGAGGLFEKQVTLRIAGALAEELRERHNAAVTMTRTGDKYLTLAERNLIANHARSDLFVSIHANAATHPDARGFQTYYLNNATDAAARKLAARENSAAGHNLSELDAIVSTMLQNAFTEDSAALARSVQKQAVRHLGERFDRITDGRVHSALFYVLVGAKSPAILVETAFLSNPEEEQRLRDPAYQTALAQGIAAGIADFWQRQRRNNL